MGRVDRPVSQLAPSFRRTPPANAAASSAYLRLGLLQDKQGDHAGALASFRSAVAIDPTLKTAVPSSYQSKVNGG